MPARRCCPRTEPAPLCSPWAGQGRAGTEPQPLTAPLHGLSRASSVSGRCHPLRELLLNSVGGGLVVGQTPVSPRETLSPLLCGAAVWDPQHVTAPEQPRDGAVGRALGNRAGGQGKALLCPRGMGSCQEPSRGTALLWGNKSLRGSGLSCSHTSWTWPGSRAHPCQERLC